MSNPESVTHRRILDSDEWCNLQTFLAEQVGVDRPTAIDFAVDGDLRFLSHQEMLTLWARACVRAKLPVRRTEGFNPRPKLSLPLPRPVGVASQCERLVLKLNEPMTAQSLREALSPVLPPGIDILHLADAQPDECLPQRVTYTVTIKPHERQVAADQAKRCLEFNPVWHERYVHKESRNKMIDLRPYIDSIDVQPTQVVFSLWVTAGGSAKPVEICRELGLDETIEARLLCRREIQWQSKRSTNP